MIRIKLVNPTNSGGRTGWWKTVEAVNTDKANGFALLGEFKREGLHEFNPGTVLVQCAPTGSVRRPGKAGAVYIVTDGGLRPVIEGVDWEKAFLTLRDACQRALAGEVQA